MGCDYEILNLLPRMMTDHETMTTLPHGMTHHVGTLCPFAYDDFPTSSLGICCSLRGEYLSADLDETGELDAFRQVHRTLTADQALQVATTLREIADRLAAGGFEATAWAPFAKHLATDAETGRLNPLVRSMIEGPSISIRMAADWYEKVAHLGFGVECA